MEQFQNYFPWDPYRVFGSRQCSYLEFYPWLYLTPIFTFYLSLFLTSAVDLKMWSSPTPRRRETLYTRAMEQLALSRGNNAGPGEMAQWRGLLKVQSQDLSSKPWRTHLKLENVTRTCNSRVPVVVWEVDTAESPEAHGLLASLVLTAMSNKTTCL